MSREDKVSLESLFSGLQQEMESKLTSSQKNITHPTTKGDYSENCWIDLLVTYLPKRYQVKKAFIVDINGNCSEQIDIVIFDNQYTPFLFNQGNAIFVPAESVYAVIEVKPELDKNTIEYAGKKAASVRCLYRTSAPIPHAGGVYAAKEPISILAGLVTLESSWNPPFGDSFKSAILDRPVNEIINIGCALKSGAFDFSYSSKEPLFEISECNKSLVFFFLRLLHRLQTVGTIPAIDLIKYTESLKVKS